MRELKTAILNELRQVTGNKKLRKKDILEWSTGTIEPQEGETVYYLPELQINVAINWLLGE